MMNKIIDLNEARNIVKFAKRIYPLLNGVTVEYGDVFAYYPNEFRITIPEQLDEKDISACTLILEHVNREFGAEFEINLREMSIHALLHEIGHHLDLEGKIFTQCIDEYLMADNYNRSLFDDACNDFKTRVDDFLEEVDNYEVSDEEDEELEFTLEQKQILLEKEDEALDILYRLIPTEYAADEFGARFFMTYLRGYKRCNYCVY